MEVGVLFYVLEDFFFGSENVCIENRNRRALHAALASKTRNTFYGPKLFVDDNEDWLNKYNEALFYRFFRMKKATFDRLLLELIQNDVHELIRKKYRGGNYPIQPEKSLLIFLWYMAQQDTLQSIGHSFQVTASTVMKIVNVFLYILLNIKKKYIFWPQTPEEFEAVSSGFDKYPAAKDTEVRAHAGTNVTLPCRVDINQCGTLHSVKWYRDTSRIYVFSQAGQVARAEGDATERMTVEYDESSNETLLKINPVQVDDEAIYKCEITYLEVRENCDVIQIVKLTTLVRPHSIRILGNDGESISNSTKLKPKNEGEEVEVICEALGGKPIPKIRWYNGTTLLDRANYKAHSERNGVGDGVSKLQLTLSRGDLNARFECRVDSGALEEPIISWIQVDVNVRPTRIELTVDPNGPVVQGSVVQLNCDVFGARPAAKVRWFNGSQPITDTDLLHTIPEDNRDGTYNTKSTLEFPASRWENEKRFSCYGENEVMKSMLLPALHGLHILDVRFAPVIKVSAARTVVSEGERLMLSCIYYANPQKLLEAKWLKDGKELVKIKGKHENGDIETPSIHIKNITRHDMGEYTCVLKNEVGEEKSEETIFLDVHYSPEVEVIMEPSTPVKAVNRGNVTLECNVTSGNPSALRKVRWFLGGELMTELPECNYTQPNTNETLGGPFCGIDPSILSLIKVEESFAGNYTCQGENEAGYGPESEPQELIVHYPPSPAKLRYYPSRVLKGAMVTLECTVDHPGRPDNVTFIWFRGGYEIHNSTSSNWTIQKASLETRSNFTCIASNEGGQSSPATVAINVLAPPDFSGPLVSYKGVPYTSKNVSLTCRIECFPRCSIVWYKDGYLLNTNNNPLYYVNNTDYPADYYQNIFESVESTLIWNMTNWPNKQLNRSADPSHYTCASRSTYDIGRAQVNFTTEIGVDFPPEEVKVSKLSINVVENEIPNSVKCSGKGRPKLNYAWITNLTSHQAIATKDTLQLGKMPRSAAGPYICEAHNKYANMTATVYFNVLYKPDCSIEVGERDGSTALICMAKANPPEVIFSWKIRESNDTIDYENVIKEGTKSYLILDSSVDTYRTYLCIANNSVGASVPCERYVPGTVPWYKRLGRENLIIIIASIIALIICVIIVCLVIIVLCRKKRENTKCNNPLELEEREKPDGQSPDTSGGNQQAPPPNRWPLKPGVLVHVSKIHGVNISQLSSNNNTSTPYKTTLVDNKKMQSSIFKYKLRNKSKIYARLQRLRELLGFNGHGVPRGITESASGVVTYKKIKPTSPSADTINPRKRKKPGYAPNPFSARDKMRSGAAPPVGGSADPSADPDKGFYENLPFHGMQNPPNKPISVIAPFSQQGIQSRPALPTFTQSTKSLILLPPPPARPLPTVGTGKTVQRHQSFHGFQNNTLVHHRQEHPFNFSSNLHLNNPFLKPNQVPNPFAFQSQSNLQPLLNFNPFLLPNPFSIPPKKTQPRVLGRRESAEIRRTASGINLSETPKTDRQQHLEDKRFGSLELKKHKCYSPTFYSMRCKKHAKKRPVIYALPKKIFSETKPVEGSIPIPAPRCKKHRKTEIIYAKTEDLRKIPHEDENESNTSSENMEGEVEITQAQVHSMPQLVGASPKGEQLIKTDGMKNSPTLKVSPNFIKPKTESPKGALSLKIQAKRKNSTGDNATGQSDDNAKENLPLLIPQMPILNPQANKWSPALANQQNAFYTLTTPHYKHLNVGLPPQYSATIPHKHPNKLMPRALFNNDQLSKSKSFTSAKPGKHKKPFQIPLQKCQSFRFQTAESYFQPIKNIHEEDLMRNGYVSEYPSDRSRNHHHKRDKVPKQKTKGPLVLRRPSGDAAYQQDNILQENIQLQYPQPMGSTSTSRAKPNGVVYADLDMPKSSKNSKGQEKQQQHPQESKQMSTKPKTEYATLTFNDIGQEIDV